MHSAKMREKGLAYVQLLLGVTLGALSFDWFFLPHNIAPGGVTGVAALINHLLGLPVGLVAIVLNAPLFLAGYRSVGRVFAFRSLVAMLIMSGLIDIIPQVSLTGDVLLAAAYGGLLLGIGLGLVLRAGATTGGTDLLAKLVHTHWSPVSVGGVLLGIDCLVVAAAALVFDAQAALYAIIALAVSSKVLDMVLEGGNRAKQFLVISDHGPEIARRINEQLQRGVTLLPAIGAYSGEARHMVFCVVSNVEVARLKALIAAVDPKAFVTVSNIHEAMGEGFQGLVK
ncbi:MAG: YitT family protein [Oscillospiraceae bacterium]|nr:YitT family protein [Oscillospiraceae bacterium]